MNWFYGGCCYCDEGFVIAVCALRSPDELRFLSSSSEEEEDEGRS
jgi:hypothetical protein